MMLAATRLTYRINRFEIRAVLLATIVSVAVSALVIGWLRNSGYDSCIDAVDATPTCLQLQGIGGWVTRIANLSMRLAGFFPILAGLLLGAPLVARELERGTARLAWSLGPGRRRWYLQRVLPVLVVVTLAAMTIGIVAEQLTALFNPDVDLGRSFTGFGDRGVLLATGALLVASVAVAVGAVVGRQIPTIAIALVLGGLTLLAVGEIDRRTLEPEAVRLTGESSYTHDLPLGDGRFELPDGRIVTYDELVAIDPTIAERGFDYPYVQVGIPRERYREIEAREAVADVALSLVFLATGAAVVLRRRPG
jgi:hypothetical protein